MVFFGDTKWNSDEYRLIKLNLGVLVILWIVAKTGLLPEAVGEVLLHSVILAGFLAQGVLYGTDRKEHKEPSVLPARFFANVYLFFSLMILCRYALSLLNGGNLYYLDEIKVSSFQAFSLVGIGDLWVLPPFLFTGLLYGMIRKEWKKKQVTPVILILGIAILLFSQFSGLYPGEIAMEEGLGVKAFFFDIAGALWSTAIGLFFCLIGEWCVDLAAILEGKTMHKILLMIIFLVMSVAMGALYIRSADASEAARIGTVIHGSDVSELISRGLLEGSDKIPALLLFTGLFFAVSCFLFSHWVKVSPPIEWFGKNAVWFYLFLEGFGILDVARAIKQKVFLKTDHNFISNASLILTVAFGYLLLIGLLYLLKGKTPTAGSNDTSDTKKE